MSRPTTKDKKAVSREMRISHLHKITTSFELSVIVPGLIKSTET